MLNIGDKVKIINSEGQVIIYDKFIEKKILQEYEIDPVQYVSFFDHADPLNEIGVVIRFVERDDIDAINKDKSSYFIQTYDNKIFWFYEKKEYLDYTEVFLISVE